MDAPFTKMKAIGDQKFCDDFLEGARDCREGNPAREDKSQDYYRGYGAEYELEQMLGHLITEAAANAT